MTEDMLTKIENTEDKDEKKEKKTKPVTLNLGLNRGLVIGDAIFENLMPDGSTSPLMVFEHGIRGTQNTIKEDSNVSNVQTTHSAKLDFEAEALRVTYTLRPLPLRADDNVLLTGDSKKPEIATQYKETLQAFVQRMLDDKSETSSISEVARRFARNILNGRPYWRNREIAVRIPVTVYSATINPDNGQMSERTLVATVGNALEKPTHSFDQPCDQEIKLAKSLEQGMRGQSNAIFIVEADINMGAPGAFEVFPSQNYLAEKERGFARSLYALGRPAESAHKLEGMRQIGQAAIRDQKIGNALRTFDTWYPDADIMGIPLAVEPNGASLSQQRYFRKPGGKNDASAFAYLKGDRLDKVESGTDEGHFLTALMMRGGLMTGIKL